MKILYICRLYSGFEESLQTGKWGPKGAPTIAKMIESLDDAHLQIILTQKTRNDPQFPKIVKTKGLRTPFTILSGPSSLPSWLWKFRDKISDLRQLCQIVHAVQKSKPDLIYCDRGNILPAALLARFTKTPVIWRVMGVLGIMYEAAEEKTVRASFKRWLWRSPFATVICTRDGSDGEPWLKKNLDKNVPYHMLLNGIDFDLKPKPIDLPTGTKALFVGRLEPMKGTEEFLKAVAKIPNLHAVIAGDGSLRPTMEKQARDLGIEKRVHFLGALSPAQLKYLRQNCDFYVSLNTHGNLTNVNLETLSDHLPTIIPKSTGDIDKDTDKLIPKDVFYRFGKVGDQKALVKAMNMMMNAQTRQKFQQAAEKAAPDILHSWRARVEQELQIYQEIMPYDMAVVIADLGSGGAQKVAMSLVQDLTKKGKKIALITLTDPSSDFHTIPPNVKRIDLSNCTTTKGMRANIDRINALRQHFKTLQPAKIVSFIAPTNILCVWANLGLSSQLIISERNDPARQSFGKLWDTLRRISYRFADCVTANSKNAIESLKAYVPERKLHFVPNALAKPPVTKAPKEKSILIVGRLHPQKNHAVLLNAFAQTRKKHPDWNLIIAGDGPLMEPLKAQAKALKISKSVTFKGTVKEPYKLYTKASIFVLPSLHEGTPNALLEAMSCGCAPIISDACEGALPYITHGKSGMITPVNDIEALAEALLAIMDNPDRCFEIGQTAQKKVAPLHEKSTADLWQSVLEE